MQNAANGRERRGRSTVTSDDQREAGVAGDHGRGVDQYDQEHVREEPEEVLVAAAHIVHSTWDTHRPLVERRATNGSGSTATKHNIITSAVLSNNRTAHTHHTHTSTTTHIAHTHIVTSLKHTAHTPQHTPIHTLHTHSSNTTQHTSRTTHYRHSHTHTQHTHTQKHTHSSDCMSAFMGALRRD